jgi:hypothetical protein
VTVITDGCDLKSISIRMPVQIGATPHSFSDPTVLLSDCHRRIEMFLGSLEKVGAHIQHPLSNETRAALESALRYFGRPRPNTPPTKNNLCFRAFVGVRTQAWRLPCLRSTTSKKNIVAPTRFMTRWICSVNAASKKASFRVSKRTGFERQLPN